MPSSCQSRRPGEIALIQAQLQVLAEDPGLIQRMNGHRELDGLVHQPRDSRRPTDPRSRARHAADNRSYWRDQSANYASGLL